MPLTPSKRSLSDYDRGTVFDYSSSSLHDSSHQSYLYPETGQNLDRSWSGYDPSQKEWLKWCLDQEVSEIKGGILMDNSELGRKIQAISLVITARKHNSSAKSESSCSSSDGHNRCTLIVCSRHWELLEWKKEIDKLTLNARYFLYEGAEGATSVDFSSYDIVITTCTNVISQYKMQFGRSECKESAEQTENETSSKTIKKAKIMTSNNPSPTSGRSLLHSERWERIILDNAIFGRTTLTAKAVHALDSKYKWALNFTPLQNIKTDEKNLHALICFLKVFPYSYYRCIACKCTKHENAQHFDSSGFCISENCKHHSSRHYTWWTKNITEKRKAKDSVQEAKRLYNEVLKKVLFTHTKSE